MDLAGLEERARALMPRSAYDYVAGGADDEVTLAANVEAWGRLRLRPHVLRDVGEVSTVTTVLGRDVSLPVLIGPAAVQGLAHEDAEPATARAAAAARTVLTVSTFATAALEDIAAAAPGATRWFQLYVHVDRGLTAELVARAAAAGYRALVVTVDVPFAGRRRRDERNRFAPDLPIASLGTLPAVGGDGSHLHRYVNAALDASLTFSDLGWLRDLSDLPMVVKGVLRGDDARACVDEGAAAVAVSNHGGRQLDTAIATAEALPEVVQAVGDAAQVYVDGGIRRGTDVVKALALGARAVMVVRPVLWGLATGGEGGVAEVLEGLRRELRLALALCGCASAAEVSRDLVTTGGRRAW